MEYTELMYIKQSTYQFVDMHQYMKSNELTITNNTKLIKIHIMLYSGQIKQGIIPVRNIHLTQFRNIYDNRMFLIYYLLILHPIIIILSHWRIQNINIRCIISTLIKLYCTVQKVDIHFCCN